MTRDDSENVQTKKNLKTTKDSFQVFELVGSTSFELVTPAV